MSGLTEPILALVSTEHQENFIALLDIQRDTIAFSELNKEFEQTQYVLIRVAQYSQPIGEVQMVFNHPNQVVDLHGQITHLQSKQFLAPQCDQTTLEQQIQTVTNEWDEARMRPAAPGKDAEPRQELAYLTQDTQQAVEEVCGLRT
jgi:hypothetical protein